MGVTWIARESSDVAFEADGKIVRPNVCVCVLVCTQVCK